MTDEDLVAAKLKGYTCLIKFKDGEELLIKADLGDDDDDELQWFQDVEKFINGCDEEIVEYFPGGAIALSRQSVKYIKKI